LNEFSCFLFHSSSHNSFFFFFQIKKNLRYGRKVSNSEDEFNPYEAHRLIDEDQDSGVYGWFPCNYTEWIEEEDEQFEVEDEFLNDEENEEVGQVEQKGEEEENENQESAVYYATVIADYVPEDGASSYLSLNAGDYVCVLKSDESGWCFGYVYNEENEENVSEDEMGWFPETYLDWGEEEEEEILEEKED